MTQEPPEDKRGEIANRVLDAHVFRRLGVSPNSKWAKSYSKMMRQPLTEEEWRAHQEKLKDPKYAGEWLDMVVSGWRSKKTSPSLRRRSRT